MSNTFLNGLQTATNFTRTENGAITHKTSGQALLDMFALGGAYRKRSDEDVILLFKNAYEEDPMYALKCLFYLRDVRGGQGERRFFRVCMKWLANNQTAAAARNLEHIPLFGRWDDLYIFVGTPLEDLALDFMYNQLALDVGSKTPSLLAKWLKSENTSSSASCHLGTITRKHFNMSHKQYRKTLSILRKRINVLERLMSEGRWDEIEFDKIPSKAGLKYKNAFARHDVERMREGAVQSYADFAKDKNTKVNAGTLYPYEVVEKAMVAMGCSYWGRSSHSVALDDTDRLMVNKYWDNLTDYFNGANFNAMAVVDTSGSMRGTPLNVAISLGLYCADKAKGPFAGHYISFSRVAKLIKTEGVDFCDKVRRLYDANLCENTNIESVFDLMLYTAINNRCTQDDLPKNIIIISDMEFDAARGHYGWGIVDNTTTLMESIRKKWAVHKYEMPHLIYWNVDARQNNIPETFGSGNISFVSGFSPAIFQQIMTGKTGIDLMYEKLNSDRYSVIK